MFVFLPCYMFVFLPQNVATKACFIQEEPPPQAFFQGLFQGPKNSILN